MHALLNLLIACFLGQGNVQAEPDPTLKPLTRRFKVTGVDVKARILEVREAAYEVCWEARKTLFYHHRSIPLKSLAKGTAIHVFGKLHERRRGGANYGETESLMTDVQYLGLGSAHRRPSLTAKSAGVAWHLATLGTSEPAATLRVGGRDYRLVGAEGLAAYSTEPAAPESLARKTVVVGGEARKVTVERGGKEKQLTRVNAREIHLLDLTPEHQKLFDLQWIAPPRVAPDAKEKAAEQDPDPSKAPGGKG